jgi:hypothetical protein
MNIKKYSLEAQELILTRKKVMARYSGRKIETLYYIIRLWLLEKKRDQNYKKRRKIACKKK